MCWMPFNASLTQTTSEVLLRDDFTLKIDSYCFTKSICSGEHWLFFPKGQLMLHEANWATSVIIPLPNLTGKIHLTPEP